MHLLWRRIFNHNSVAVKNNFEILQETTERQTSNNQFLLKNFVEEYLLQNFSKNSVEDRQVRLAWQAVNEINGKKSLSRPKLKATSQEERLLKWKEHFKNLLGNQHEIMDKFMEKNFKSQLNLNILRKKNFTHFGKKLKAEKYGRQGNLTTYFLDYATKIKTQKRNRWKTSSFPSQERWPRNH